MNYYELEKEAVQALEDAKVPNAKTDAELLLFEAFDIDKSFLLMRGNETIDNQYYEEKDGKPSAFSLFMEGVEKRKKRIPLQHILGYQNFMGLNFCVNDHVLIPRFDTEILVEETLPLLHDGMRIMDMCTGSGCILISLLNYSNDCFGLGVDISERALEVAKENAQMILDQREDVTYSFVKSDIFEDLDVFSDKFDIIVSNPPYINSDVIDSLEPEVREHDPLIALDGGSDGMDFYRKIISGAESFLVPGGDLVFEIGFDQAKRVTELLENADYCDIRVIKDYSGLDRVVMARRTLK